MPRRLVDFVGLIVCIILVSPIPLAAQEDTTPPVLTAFDFTPKTIDTTSTPETVTVTFSATDDLSGLDNIAYLQFRSPSGTHILEVWADCEKGSRTCSASVDVPFPAYSEAGAWTVYMMYVRDVVGNTRTYSSADLAAMGWPTQLLNTDQAVPELLFVNAGAVPAGPKGRWTAVTLQALVATTAARRLRALVRRISGTCRRPRCKSTSRAIG